MGFTVEQAGDSFQVEPLSYRDLSIEEFYSYGSPDTASANTPTDLEQSDVSRLFLYEGPKGISLVVIHDAPNDGDGGDVRFKFDTLPADGSWVVPDDPGEVFSRTRVDWRWFPCCTDGGAYRGGLDEEFSLTVSPSFNAGISAWEFLSGSAASPDRFSLDRGQPVTISTAGGTVSASTTILSFIPGESENTTRGGSPFNSAVSQILPEGYVIEEPAAVFDQEYSFRVETTPLFDNWGTGDMLLSDEYPLQLQEALAATPGKYEEDGGLDGPKYRTRNRVEITFETTGDGGIDESTVEVELSGEATESVAEGEAVNTLYDDIATDDSHVLPGGYRDRYYSVDTIQVDGVDAVRVATIFGGYSRIAAAALDLLSAQDPFDFLTETLEWQVDVEGLAFDELALSHLSGLIGSLTDMLVAVPNIYSFLEVVVTADDRRFVRLWDNSKFPEHAVFVDEVRAVLLDFPDEAGAVRELLHINFLAFLLEAAAGLTPYYGPKRRYLDCLQSGTCGGIAGFILDVLADIPTVDEDDLDSYSSISPPPGEPNWQFGTEGVHTGGGENELPDSEIRAVLPGEPLEPFDGRLSHQENRVVRLNPF